MYNLYNSGEQTIIHMFSACSVVSIFWKEVLSWLKAKNVIINDPSISHILFGHFDIQHKLFLNSIFILGKSYIFSCKCLDVLPNFQIFTRKLYNLYELECHISLIKNSTKVNSKKWNLIYS